MEFKKHITHVYYMPVSLSYWSNCKYEIVKKEEQNSDQFQCFVNVDFFF